MLEPFSELWPTPLPVDPFMPWITSEKHQHYLYSQRTELDELVGGEGWEFGVDWFEERARGNCRMVYVRWDRTLWGYYPHAGHYTPVPSLESPEEMESCCAEDSSDE